MELPPSSLPLFRRTCNLLSSHPGSISLLGTGGPVPGKPILSDGNSGIRYKQTFAFLTTGELLGASKPTDASEKALQRSSREYEGMLLLASFWEELAAPEASSEEPSLEMPWVRACGTCFLLAAPAGGSPVFGGAGHCLRVASQQRFSVLLGSEARRLKADVARRVVTNIPPLDIGFMELQKPLLDPQQLLMNPQQLFIPCARALVPGELVSVLGFVGSLTLEWARTALRTQDDLELLQFQAKEQGMRVAPDWKLSEEETLYRLDQWLREQDRYLLVAAPGKLVKQDNHFEVEHGCSTFPGMSGGPGVDLHTPWKLLFIHTGGFQDVGRYNCGCSVNHPLFFKAYVDKVLPGLLATPSSLLTPDKVQCLLEYLVAHRDELPDLSVLDKVKELLVQT